MKVLPTEFFNITNTMSEVNYYAHSNVDHSTFSDYHSKHMYKNTLYEKIIEYNNLYPNEITNDRNHILNIGVYYDNNGIVETLQFETIC